jgi:16S rRNA (cytosine967-C5)-methyltransferase
MRENRPRKVDDVRDKALDIIYDVFEKGAYTNLQLDKDLRGTHFAISDRRFVTELVNGTVRMSKHLDWVLNLFLRKPLDKQNPWVRNILRLALYQILFMDKIPPYASVNTAVNQTMAKTGSGLTGMVNGVLRNIIRNRDKITYPPPDRNPIDYMAVYYSHPEWLVRQWAEEYGNDKTMEMLSYNNLPPQTTLRCNSLKTTPKNLTEALELEAIFSTVCPYQPWALLVSEGQTILSQSQPFKDGWFYIQDAASMFAAPILNPVSGQLVYDLCCGVGGKATHMAELMQNEGRIIAIDLYQHKIDLLNYNCQRLGINIINGVTADILCLNADSWEKAPRVLLDAPCSGLGVLNRRSDARWRKNCNDIKELTRIQASLLQKASHLVEKNGLLLYSTCTINKSENEDIINDFLSSHPEYVPEGFTEALAHLPLSTEEKEKAAAGMFTFLPGRYGTNGMFYALMRRN